MKIKIVVVQLFFVLFLDGTFAQTPKYEPLLNRFLDENLSDRERLDALLALDTMNFKSIYPDSVIQLFEQAQPIIKRIGTPRDVMLQKSLLGVGYYRSGNIEKGLELEEDAAAMASISKDTLTWAKALVRQGACHYAAKRYELAAEKMLQSVELGDLIGYPSKGAVSNLGTIFHVLGDHAKARTYLNRARERLKQDGNYLSEMRTVFVLGETYKLEDNFEDALAMYLQGYEMFEKHAPNARLLLSKYLSSIGEVYINLEDFENAKQYILQALALQKQLGDSQFGPRMSSYGELGKVNLGLAGLYQQPSLLDSALYYAQLAHDSLLLKGGLLYSPFHVKSTLVRIHHRRGEFEKALEYSSECRVLQDSINEEKRIKEVYQLESQYEYEKQKAAAQLAYEKSLAAQQIRSQRRFYLSTGVGMLIIGMLSIFLVSSRNQRASEQKENLYKIEELKKRLAMQSVTSSNPGLEHQLDKDRLEGYLGKELGETSWNIIKTIFEKPTIGNRELAEKVFLSSSGLDSALRRLYKSFHVKTESNRNKKVAMLAKVVKISLGEEE